MPINLAELRRRLGSVADGYTDQELAQAAQEAFAPNADQEQFQRSIGYNPGDNFSRGMRIGGLNTMATLGGAGASVADAVGWNSGRDAALEYARAQQQRAFQLGRTYDDVDNAGQNPLGFAASALGQGAAYAAPSLISGGAGALAARALGMRALSGAAAGSYLSNTAQEAGGIYNDLAQQGRADPARAWMYGAGAGAVDTAAEAVPFLRAPGTGGLVRRMVTGGLMQAPIEGGTEVLQSAIEREAAYKPLGGPEAENEYRNAFALGAIPGFGFGAVGGMRGHSPMESAPSVVPPDNTPPAYVDLLNPAPQPPQGPPSAPPSYLDLMGATAPPQDAGYNPYDDYWRTAPTPGIANPNYAPAQGAAYYDAPFPYDILEMGTNGPIPMSSTFGQTGGAYAPYQVNGQTIAPASSIMATDPGSEAGRQAALAVAAGQPHPWLRTEASPIEGQPTITPAVRERAKQLLGSSTDRSVVVLDKMDKALAAGTITQAEHEQHANDIALAKNARSRSLAMKAAEAAAEGTKRVGEAPGAAPAATATTPTPAQPVNAAAPVQPSGVLPSVSTAPAAAPSQAGPTDVGVRTAPGPNAPTSSGVRSAVPQGSVAAPGRDAAPAVGNARPAGGVAPNDAQAGAVANAQAQPRTPQLTFDKDVYGSLDEAVADATASWDAQASTIPGAPLFQDLHPDAQQMLIDAPLINGRVFSMARDLHAQRRGEEQTAARNARNAALAVDPNEVAKQISTFSSPRAQEAMRLAVGIDEYGNLLPDGPMDVGAAAKKAGYTGAQAHSTVSKNLTKLGLTAEKITRMHAGRNGVENPALLSKEQRPERTVNEDGAVEEDQLNSFVEGSQDNLPNQEWHKRAKKVGYANLPARDLGIAAAEASRYADDPNSQADLAELQAAIKAKLEGNRDLQKVFSNAYQAHVDREPDVRAQALGSIARAAKQDGANSAGVSSAQRGPGQPEAGSGTAGAGAGEKPKFRRVKKDELKNAQTGGLTVGPRQTVEVSHEEMLDNSIFGQAHKWLRTIGLDKAANWVSSWHLFDGGNPDLADGWLTNHGARYSITINVGKGTGATQQQLTYMHELGHAVDMVGHGGVYSSQPTMAKGGAVYEELHTLYLENDPDTFNQTPKQAFWGVFLEYPFNARKFGLDEFDVSSELFAQLFAAYSHPKTRAYLKADAPRAYAFMEAVAKDVQTRQARSVHTVAQANDAFVKFFQDQAAQIEAGVEARAAGGGTRLREGGGDARLFSQGAAARAAAVDSLKDLPDALRPASRTIGAVLRTFGEKALNLATFTDDLLDRAAGMGLAAASKYKDLSHKKASFIGHHERRVLDAMSGYAQLPSRLQGTGEGTVNDYLYNSTRERKWGYQPKWLDHQVTIDPETAKAYEALGPEGKAFVDTAFKIGADTLAQKKEVVLSTTASEYDALIAAAQKAGEEAEVQSLTKDKEDALKKFGSLFRISGKDPYSPIKRFGDWVVIAKSQAYQAAEANGDQKLMRELESSAKDYHVDFFDSEAQAISVHDQLKNEFDGEVIYRAKEDGRDLVYGGSKTLQALSKLRARVDMLPEGDRATAKKLRELLTDMYIQQLAEDSARKSELRRRGIAGNIDMIRSLEAQGKADAAFIGNVKYNDELLQSLNDMRRELRSRPDQKNASLIFNEILKRHLQALDFKPTPIADVLTRAPSIWFLATSPAYYLQNLTQPWTMSLPMMAGRHDVMQTGSALTEAYRAIAPVLKTWNVFDNFDFQKLFDGKALSVGEKDMLQQLLDAGKLDIGMATELGQTRADQGGATRSVLDKVMNGMRGLQLKMEAINRLSTALAAYRLELGKTQSHEQASKYAGEIIQTTHGDYSAWNAPRPFNTALGKVALQFRKFQLIQLTMLAKLLKNSFGSGTKEEKAIARRALAYTLGQAMILGGGKALPIPFALAWLFAKVFGEGEDEPPEYVLRRMIGDKDVADLLINGLPAKLIGVNGAALGVGFGNSVSALPFTDLDLTNRKSVAEAGFALMSGPMGGLTLRAADGIGYMVNGDYYRGLEMLAPKGVGSVLKSARVAADGVTQKDGDITMSADEVSTFDTIQQAVGFTPQAQIDRMYRQKAAYDIGQAMTKDSSSIKAEYAKAIHNGDSAAAAEARQRWNEYQDTRVRMGFAKQPLSDLLKAPAEQAKRERNTAGNVQYTKGREKFVRELEAN